MSDLILPAYSRRHFYYDTLSADEVADVDHLQGEIRLPEEDVWSWNPIEYIDSDCFSFLSAIIVISNLATMFFEVMYPKREALDILDHFYLFFYIFELTLRYLHKKEKMLWSSFSESWWNWLDLFVVCVAIIDQWVLPLLCAVGLIEVGEGSQALALVRVLRLLRLLRLFKVLRSFLNVNTAWVERETFQTFMMFVIALNAIAMGLEADISLEFLWHLMEQVILGIFVFELAVRLKENKSAFFCHAEDWKWNYLDFVIVIGGVADQWMLPAVFFFMTLAGMRTPTSGTLGQIMMILRIARLLRILRLVRLVRSLPALRALVVGVFKAMQGIFWVMVLTFIFVYLISLVSVKLIGHGLLFGGVVPEEIDEVFPTVHDAMWAYFLCMTGEYGPLEPLFTFSGWFKLMVALYVIVSSWAILSVLTSVVCDKMSQAQSEIKADDDLDAQRLQLEQTKNTLHAIFKTMDADDSDVVSKQEWTTMMKDAPRKKELSNATGLSPHDIEEMFDWMCHSTKPDNEEIVGMSLDDFINGFKIAKQNVTERSLLRLEKRMRGLEQRVQKTTEASHEVATETRVALEDIVRSVGRQVEQHEISALHSTIAQLQVVVQAAVDASSQKLSSQLEETATRMEEHLHTTLHGSPHGWDLMKFGMGRAHTVDLERVAPAPSPALSSVAAPASVPAQAEVVRDQIVPDSRLSQLLGRLEKFEKRLEHDVMLDAQVARIDACMQKNLEGIVAVLGKIDEMDQSRKPDVMKPDPVDGASKAVMAKLDALADPVNLTMRSTVDGIVMVLGRLDKMQDMLHSYCDPAPFLAH